MKKVIFLPAAARALRKHRSDAARLIEKITSYAADAVALGNNVKALRGSTAKRLRVGDFRIIFEETEDEIVVTLIGPRGSVYDRG